MKVILTNDGSRTLFCELTGQSFHSESGAWSEAQHVYLKNSGIVQRLADHHSCRILEIGLGTGLNFLLAADQAIRLGARLDYTGLDWQLPTADLVRELNFQYLLKNDELLNLWLDVLMECEKRSPDHSHLEFELASNVRLAILFGHAEKWVVSTGHVTPLADEKFDAIFMDAFSPDASPELWTGGFLAGLGRVVADCGTLTTYCVKSEVRKRLQACGFSVRCVAGPAAGKRQVMIATRQNGAFKQTESTARSDHAN